MSQYGVWCVPSHHMAVLLPLLDSYMNTFHDPCQYPSPRLEEGHPWPDGSTWASPSLTKCSALVVNKLNNTLCYRSIWSINGQVVEPNLNNLNSIQKTTLVIGLDTAFKGQRFHYWKNKIIWLCRCLFDCFLILMKKLNPQNGLKRHLCLVYNCNFRVLKKLIYFSAGTYLMDT